MTEFEGAYSRVVDRVKGREEAGVYGGVGNTASSKLHQQRIHWLEHQHYSRILQEVKEGFLAPGASFPVSSKAAAAQGMSNQELKNLCQRLVTCGIVEKQGPGKFKIHQNAQNIIAGNQEFIWRANNVTRLQKTADNPEMPGTWAQQALLEIIASGDIKPGYSFPSLGTVQKAFQVNNQAFGPKLAAVAFVWLERIGLIARQSQTNIKFGYIFTPNAQAQSQNILNDFRLLDANPARPLLEIPPVYKSTPKTGHNLEISFAPDLNQGQEMVAVFAHLLAKISSGEFTSETGMPSSRQAIEQLGLPGKVLLASHSRVLVDHNIIPKKDHGQSQLNAHRDQTPLMPDAQDKIDASPYFPSSTLTARKYLIHMEANQKVQTTNEVW